MTVVPLTPSHVDAAARLHRDTLTGLLTALGPRAIHAYYAGAARAPSVRAYAAMDGETLAGFVLGSARPADLRREIVRANRIEILAGLAIGVAARPAALRWLLGGSRRVPAEGGHDPAAPELVYIAVSASCRGGGTGRLLVVAFTEAMKNEGVRFYDLSVDESNAGAIAFYERLGFRETGRYREFGAEHRRYRLELA